MPKRASSVCTARALVTPSSVGSTMTMKCAALTTNGRTAAANGCGASTTTSSVVSRRSPRMPATWSGISVNAPSIDAVNSMPATSFRIVADAMLPPTRPPSNARTVSVSTATQRRPLKSASTRPHAFDSRSTRDELDAQGGRADAALGADDDDDRALHRIAGPRRRRRRGRRRSRRRPGVGRGLRRGGRGADARGRRRLGSGDAGRPVRSEPAAPIVPRENELLGRPAARIGSFGERSARRSVVLTSASVSRSACLRRRPRGSRSGTADCRPPASGVRTSASVIVPIESTSAPRMIVTRLAALVRRAARSRRSRRRGRRRG